MITWGFWLRFAGLAGLIFDGSSLVSGDDSYQTAAKVVEAEVFVLRDPAGKRRAELGLQDGEPRFSLFDKNGKCRVRLAVLADGGSQLSFYDDKGRDKGVLHVRTDGEPTWENGDKKNNGPVKPAGPNKNSAPNSVSPAKPAVQEPPADNALLRKAEPLYQQYCASCHGANGQGTRSRARMPSIPDFTAAHWQAGRSDGQFLSSILDGRGRDMPAFSGELKIAQARALVAYVRSFGPSVAASGATPLTEFDHKLHELRKQYEDLDRQIRSLAPTPEKR
jgi:mono/diheme cytochrome c family protein